MVEINLLPWRKKKYQYESKIFKNTLIIAIIFSIVLIYGLHWLMAIYIHTTEIQVSLQQEDLFKLKNLQHPSKESSSENNASEERVRQFINYQSSTAHFLSQLTQLPMKNVCFTAISRVDNTFSFLGFTRSAEDLKKVLHFLNVKVAFKDITVINLHERIENQVFHFHFTAVDQNISPVGSLDQEKENRAGI